MATVARAEIEALLRARKLDTTLTTARPLEASGNGNAGALPGTTTDGQFVVATGIAALDQRLGGGLARGQLSEIVGPRSSGRTSIVLSAMAGAASRGELVALVDTFDTFDPPSARACGLDLSRLLWVRGRWIDRPRSSDGARERRGALGPPGTPARLPRWGPRPQATELGGVQGSPPFKRSSDNETQAVDRALKALNLILQAGGFGLVVLDLADASRPAIRRLPFTTWFRLQRPVEGSSTACVLLAGEPTARSAGGVTVALRRVELPPTRGSTCSPRAPQRGCRAGDPAGAEPVEGRQPRWGALFTGFEVEACIGRARGVAETCRFSCAATL